MAVVQPAVQGCQGLISRMAPYHSATDTSSFTGLDGGARAPLLPAGGAAELRRRAGVDGGRGGQSVGVDGAPARGASSTRRRSAPHWLQAALGACALATCSAMPVALGGAMVDASKVTLPDWQQVGGVMSRSQVQAISMSFSPDGLPVFAYGWNDPGVGNGTRVPVMAWNGEQWIEVFHRCEFSLLEIGGKGGGGFCG
jgi:hypothetical protein